MKTLSRRKRIIRTKPIGVSGERSKDFGVKETVEAVEDVIGPQGEADGMEESAINREIGDIDIAEEVVGVELVVGDTRRARAITKIILGMVEVEHKILVNRRGFQRREVERELFGDEFDKVKVEELGAIFFKINNSAEIRREPPMRGLASDDSVVMAMKKK